MLKRTTRLVIGLLLLHICHNGASAGAGWTTYGRVIELQPTTAGRFLVRLDGVSNPSGCRDESWFYRDYTGGEVELLFHALLGAVSSNLAVRVYVSGRCDLNGYSEISSAGIAP